MNKIKRDEKVAEYLRMKNEKKRKMETQFDTAKKNKFGRRSP